MRITKLPIPLLIAAAALTSVAVIYVYFTAPPMPIHTDPNFTTPLFAGGTYLWRGAAYDYIFSADDDISLTYKPPHYLLITNGPLGNFSIGDNTWIIYVTGERPLMIVRHYVWRPWGDYPGSWGYEWLIFKLTDVTPPNLSNPHLTVWLPTLFELTEDLSDREYQAARTRVGQFIYRVINIEVNGTHIIFRVSYTRPWGGSYEEIRFPSPLPSPISGKTIRINNNPISTSYNINGTMLTGIALPYHYFSISASKTTNLVIYVS